jgi:hypothetical protein
MNGASRELEAKVPTDALKCRIVKGEYQMALGPECPGSMSWMYGIHPLESADPRGVLDFERGVRFEPTSSQRMPLKRLVVRWSKHVSDA